MLLLPPSVAKRDPESNELSTELHCWDVKWRGNIEEAKCCDSPSKAMRERDRILTPNKKLPEKHNDRKLTQWTGSSLHS